MRSICSVLASAALAFVFAGSPPAPAPQGEEAAFLNSRITEMIAGKGGTSSNVAAGGGYNTVSQELHIL